VTCASLSQNLIPLESHESIARRFRDLRQPTACYFYGLQTFASLESQQSTARRSRDLRQPVSQNLILTSLLPLNT
jgi:hypothetical protein